MTRSLENWKIFKKVVKNTKRLFFDEKIQEKVNKNQGSWELMDWVNKQKLPTIEAIKYDDQPCVVATTRQNSTRDMLTSAKLSVGYLVVGIIRELNKEPSLYLSSIYITGSWSVLQQ